MVIFHRWVFFLSLSACFANTFYDSMIRYFVTKSKLGGNSILVSTTLRHFRICWHFQVLFVIMIRQALSHHFDVGSQDSRQWKPSLYLWGINLHTLTFSNTVSARTSWIEPIYWAFNFVEIFKYQNIKLRPCWYFTTSHDCMN